MIQKQLFEGLKLCIHLREKAQNTWKNMATQKYQHMSQRALKAGGLLGQGTMLRSHAPDTAEIQASIWV